jgi:hypothetical protein
MQFVRGRRCDDDLGIAGDVDLAALPRAVGDADTAQFDVVFRRDDDLGMGLEITVASSQRIAAAKLGPPFGEDRFVADPVA